MKKGMIVFLIIAGIIIIVGFNLFNWYVGVFNNGVRLDQNVKAAWAQVENQYQRRFDMIPNLVEIVKGYAKHEKSTLESVIEMRSKVSQMTVNKDVLDDPEAFKRFQKAQGEISSFLSRLMVITEAYPELKANQNFLALQSQLEGTENRISVERKRFNESVQEFNFYISSFFPRMVLGSKYKERAYFEAEENAITAPKIQF